MKTTVERGSLLELATETMRNEGSNSVTKENRKYRKRPKSLPSSLVKPSN